MQQKTALYGFTLMELLVGIAMVSILALGSAQFNFRRLSQNQEVEVEAVKIINIFEETRDNALIGRAVLSGSTLITPESWEVTISSAGGGNIVSGYTHSDGSTGNGPSWSNPGSFSLQNLECQKLLGNSTGSVSGNPTIQFIGSVGSITGCPDSSYKIISFEYGIGPFIKDISINVLSGVIENN